MRTFLVSLLCVFLVTQPMQLAWGARKPNYKAAKRLFAEGLALFEEKDFLHAAKKFQAAFDITQDPVVLFNVGEAYARANRPKEAIAAYEAYLQSPAADRDRASVERKIAALRQKVASKTPAAPAPAPTFPQLRGISPPPTKPVAKPVGPRPQPLAPAPISPAAEERSSWMTIAKWTGVGVTVALAATAGLMAVAARSRQDDIGSRQNYRDPQTGQPLEYNAGSNAKDVQDLYDQGDSYKNLSVLFLILSGAAAASTVTLFVLDSKSSEERPRASIKPPGIGVGAGPGHASVRLGWSF